jgi:hypothetical protein
MRGFAQYHRHYRTVSARARARAAVRGIARTARANRAIARTCTPGAQAARRAKITQERRCSVGDRLRAAALLRPLARRSERRLVDETSTRRQNQAPDSLSTSIVSRSKPPLNNRQPTTILSSTYVEVIDRLSNDRLTPGSVSPTVVSCVVSLMTVSRQPSLQQPHLQRRLNDDCLRNDRLLGCLANGQMSLTLDVGVDNLIDNHLLTTVSC